MGVVWTRRKTLVYVCPGRGLVFEFRFDRANFLLLSTNLDRYFFLPFATAIMDEAQELLVDKFRLTSFRGHQEAVIRRLLVDNENALAVMPTGAS